jgi:hypothetical protein
MLNDGFLSKTMREAIRPWPPTLIPRNRAIQVVIFFAQHPVMHPELASSG